MHRLVIMAIDSLDRELVNRYLNNMPNVKRIVEKSGRFLTRSVFPPDSDTAWATIYSGLDPSYHGVVEFVDPLDRSKLTKSQAEYVDISHVRGRTFWDIASSKKKRVCLINPHLGFPVWPVNGVMLHADPNTGSLHISPPDYAIKFVHRSFEHQKRIPRSKLEFRSYLTKKAELVMTEFEFFGKMYQQEPWDLFMFYSSGLDAIMHLYWNYCDPADPTYPGRNDFESAIEDFHILYDHLIGTFLQNLTAETSVLIISDHGHSMRPVNLININEILKGAGFLKGRGGSLAPLLNYKERLKRHAATLAQRAGLRVAAMTLVRTFPKIKKMYTTPSTIDFQNSLAWCTDLSGMKAYTYGGIHINKYLLSDPTDYERTRSSIIELLKQVTLPATHQPAFDFIERREALYTGPFVQKYPDIVFNLKEGYGAGWSINVPVYSTSMAHKFYPGSHRGSTPVFYLLNSSEKSIARRDIAFIDYLPTILDLLDIDPREFNCAGKSIFQ